MEFLKSVFLIVAVLFAIDRLARWAERKGWVYYRDKRPRGSDSVGNALQELNSFMNPSARHVIELKQNDFKKRDDQGDQP